MRLAVGGWRMAVSDTRNVDQFVVGVISSPQFCYETTRYGYHSDVGAWRVVVVLVVCLASYLRLRCAL